MHWELKTFVQLSVTEAGIIWPLLTNLSPKDNLTFPMKSECNKAIEQFYKKDMRRALVHAMVLLGGRADIKQLKHQLEDIDIYTDSEFFEEELIAVANQHRDHAGGKVQFKLKEDAYLSWFEPYYYLQPKSQVKVHEVLQGIYADRKLVNEVLGDFAGTYQYATHVN